jgi:hypothetical protein
MLRSVLVLGVLGLSGCGDGPAGPQSPPPVVSAPRVQLIPFVFTCNRFSPPINPEALVLADLYLGTGIEAAVQEAGGRVVHRFNVPVLRVEIRAGSIPGLPKIDQALGVTDAGRHGIKEAVVTYSRTTTEADVQQLKALGGSEIHQLQSVDLIVATLPDASIPSVRRLGGVTEVGLEKHVCMDDFSRGA